MKLPKINLIWKVLAAIIVGAIIGNFTPQWFVTIFYTFNDIFGNFLKFIIPLIIIGLVVPGIADLGEKAGKLLILTVVIAYIFSIFSGFVTYFVSDISFDILFKGSFPEINSNISESEKITPAFTISMPPMMDVMSALILSFLLGIGIAISKSESLKKVTDEFGNIIKLTIEKIIIPILPIYIFGIFLNMSYNGTIFGILSTFGKIFIIIILLQIFILLIQFIIAGIISKRNPFKMLINMLPAYFTALGTSSSAATIPVTLKQVLKIGVNPDIAGFTVPLCATIHLSGSMIKIVCCSMAILLLNGVGYTFEQYSFFIMMLAITMIAAPGVPGGAIMAAIGILESILGFDTSMTALIIALYIAIDSLGTACNVTGDGAIAVIIDKWSVNSKKK